MSNKNNSKRILCNHILCEGRCSYGRSCIFAHSLSEQIVDPLRHKVHTMLDNKTDMAKINLVNDNDLYNTFYTLTKLCKYCKKGLCSGGLNCRHGAHHKKYCICFYDFMYGCCLDNDCKLIHLTDRGLVPYTVQKKSCKKFIYPTDKIIKNKNLMDHFRRTSLYVDDDLSDSEVSSEDIDAIIEYLNRDSSDEEDVVYYNKKN